LPRNAIRSGAAGESTRRINALIRRQMARRYCVGITSVRV
jgi:hypothetical protein